MKKRILLVALVLAALALLLAACGSTSPNKSAEKEAKANADNFAPYIPHNQVEGDNYNRAQKLYDDPTTIIWCTAFPQSSTQPLVTVPIAGKLTSSSTSAFPPDRVYNGDGDSNPVIANPSVDGLYHNNPPPYRYGFTPGGQYVDFTDLPTLCTTQPLAFQRESVSVTVDQGLDSATKEAEAALESGDKQQAQALLKAAAAE